MAVIAMADLTASAHKELETDIGLLRHLIILSCSPARSLPAIANASQTAEITPD
jgi:hypothetical protein